MKHVLPWLMAIHGLIHLIGFFKESRPKAPTRVPGISAIVLDKNATLTANLSLLVCVCFIAAAIGYYIDNGWWLILAIIAMFLSQVLIIAYWRDARWGTIANIIILSGVIIGFAHRGFNNMVKSEVRLLYNTGRKPGNTVVTKEMLSGLPTPVQTWLMNSGIIGKQLTVSVRLTQNGFMRSKPDQENWSSIYAEQYFRIDEPSFVWKANMEVMPGIAIQARDKYIAGKGEMKIKLVSLIPIANASGLEVDEGSLQRWLAEMCWFPAAALSPYIKWADLDASSARATMTYRGVSGSVIFHFNAKGDITACTADRFMGSGNKMSLEKWRVKTIDYQVMNGISIPTKAEATWKLKTGDFTWLKLEIIKIEYNEPKLY
jgi:hypothetical protein